MALPAHGLAGSQYLPVEICKIHLVIVDNVESPHTASYRCFADISSQVPYTKHRHSCSRFLCRGKNNIKTEFLLFGLAYNIKKLFTKSSGNRLGISLLELKSA